MFQKISHKVPSLIFPKFKIIFKTIFLNVRALQNFIEVRIPRILSILFCTKKNHTNLMLLIQTFQCNISYKLQPQNCSTFLSPT